MDTMSKFTKVLKALNAKGERELFMTLREAIKELAVNVETAHDADIADIKRRAGIVEFVAGPEFGGNGGQPDPEGVPLWQRLQSIAKSTQGVGRIDQHQIEEIFRAAEVLKKLDR